MASPAEQIPMQPPEPGAVVKERRKLNRLSIFLLVVCSAFGTILYVSNVVRVNELLQEVQTLERSRDSLVSANEALRIETTRLRSADRISHIAAEKLGMMQPQEAPVVITTK